MTSSQKKERCAPLVILGPQDSTATVGHALKNMQIQGSVALVTAGWEAHEEEDQKLRSTLGVPCVNLALYRRGEQVARRDREFLEASRRRRDRHHQLLELYRLRLNHLVRSAKQLLRRNHPPDLLDGERTSAIELLRILDQHHLERTRAIDRESEMDLNTAHRSEVKRHRDEVAEQLQRVDALVLAGGHVAILLERLRLFDVISALGDKPVVAWSAGAMALGERIVLFHDSPPQGPGNAEVFGAGLGFSDGLLPFPHARSRLRLRDRVRVALLARRFAPDLCVALDEGAYLETSGDGWRALAATPRLTEDGLVVNVEGS